MFGTMTTRTRPLPTVSTAQRPELADTLRAADLRFFSDPPYVERLRFPPTCLHLLGHLALPTALGSPAYPSAHDPRALGDRQRFRIMSERSALALRDNLSPGSGNGLSHNTVDLLGSPDTWPGIRCWCSAPPVEEQPGAMASLPPFSPPDTSQALVAGVVGGRLHRVRCYGDVRDVWDCHVPLH
jgi:hypothetical protein